MDIFKLYWVYKWNSKNPMLANFHHGKRTVEWYLLLLLKIFKSELWLFCFLKALHRNSSKMYLLNVLAKKNFIWRSIDKKTLVTRSNLLLKGRGWEVVWQQICDKNIFLGNFELVLKSWQKMSADVKANVRQQEIKKLIGSYIL